MQHPVIAKWGEDPEFQSLPDKEKAQKISNFFVSRLADDEFRSLPQEEQESHRSRFVLGQLDYLGRPKLVQPEKEGFWEKTLDFVQGGASEDEKAQAAIALASSDIEGKAPSQFIGPDRNVVTDTAMGLARGLLADAPETLLRAGRTLGMETVDEIEGVQRFRERIFPPSFQHLNNPKRRDIVEGAASTAHSIETGVPGMLAGFTGGIPGAIAGYAVGGGTIFGLAEYDHFMEEAKALGLKPDDVKAEAVLSAAAEGGLEGVSNFLDVALMKVGKPLSTAATNRLKQFALNYVKVASSEIPTEMAQSASGTALRNKAGFPVESPWEAAKESVGPTAVSALGFAALGAGARRRPTTTISAEETTDLLADTEGVEYSDRRVPESPSKAIDFSSLEQNGETESERMKKFYKNEERIHGTEPDTALRDSLDAMFQSPEHLKELKADIQERNRFKPALELEQRINREMSIRDGWRPENFDGSESLSPESQLPLAPTPFEGAKALNLPIRANVFGEGAMPSASQSGEQYRERLFREAAQMSPSSPEVRAHPDFDPLEVEWRQRERSKERLARAANEAATSPQNNIPEPTPAQKGAGNYKKGHARILGMDVAIENPAGSERSGKSRSGKEWSVQMQHHYGYIKGTEGKDKDHLDLFIKNGVEPDQMESKSIYVVDQINEDGSFDEHKIMAGFDSEADARKGYLSNYEDGWTGLGSVTKMSSEKFKEWIKNGKTKRAVSYRRPTKADVAEIATTEIPVDDSFQPLTRSISNGLHMEAKHTLEDGAVEKAAIPFAKDYLAGKLEKTEESVGPINKQTESGPYSRESYADFMDKLNSGDIDSKTFKQNFRKVQEDKDSIIAGLRKLTKKQLLPMTGLRYTMSDKKDALVSAAYESMVNSFSLGKPISYMMAGDGLGKVRALEDIVNSVTDEDLKAHAEAHSKRRAEQDEYIKGKQKALNNPETYEDYEFFVRVKGADSLTTEQRMRWDELQAEKSGERKEAQKEHAAKVQAVHSEGVTLEYKGRTVHSKHGHDLFVVGLADRVDRSAFSELRSKAKQLGGYYSKFRGHGAIPGFQFKTKEAADKFIGLQDGDVSKTDLIEQKEEHSQNKAVFKLREMASSLRESADESLGQDRRTNTARQARMAASAEAGAEANKRLAQTMENIADAIESGESKMLSGVKAKTHIELLESRARQAKWEYDRAKGVSYEKSKESPATPEHMSAAKLPSLTFDRSVILDMAKDVETIRGGKRLALMLRTRAKRAKRVQGRHEPVYNFRLYDEKLIRDLVAKFNQSGDKYKGWQVRDRVADLDRLARMGITTDAELRVALREYLTYRGKKVKADPVKEAERALVGRKIDGYFPTPKPIVERMLEEADLEPGMNVLEPSAGKGNIADLIKEDEPEANLETIEPVQDLRTILEAKEHKLVGRNFLEHDGEYDRIIMNPPFEKRQDVEHVRSAYKLLKPGGRVVAIMSEGPFFGKDKVATNFREWLDTVGWSEKLPEGSFKSSERPTGVATRLVVIDKPDAVSGSNVAETSVKSPETTLKGAASDERQEERAGTGARVLGESDSGRGVRYASQDQGPSSAGPERQNSHRRAQGSAVNVLHSEGEDAGHYELREASDLIPSHQATQGFKKHEGYPDDVQERPYHSDENEQIKVKTNASQLDPRFVVSDNPDAVNGPPIITSDGVVLGGNSRTMSIQYSYENYPDKAKKYVDDLKRKAESFGLNSSDIDSFSQPMLVRSIDDSISRKDMARKARLYNQSRMQGLDSTAEGVSKGRMISEESMAILAQALEDYSTLRSYLDSNNSRKLIDSLLSDGVLEETQIGKLSKGTGLLNSEGKRLVELAVRGHIIDDFDTLDRLPDSTLEKLDRIVPAASKVKNRGGDWDITPILKQALQHVVKFRASKAETIETYFAQGELLGSDPSKDNSDVQSIAKAVHYAKPTAFKKMWDEYAKKAVADKKDQAALPGAEPISPGEAMSVFSGGTRLSFSKKGKAPSMNVQAVESAINALESAAINAGTTKVVQSVEDLPKYIQEVFRAHGEGRLEAAYSGGSVYFIADNIPSKKRAVELWMHEHGLHHGLRGFFGQRERSQLLNKIHMSAAKSSVYKDIVDLYGLDTNRLSDRQVAAEEYLAHIGEKVKAEEALNGHEKTIWQKLVSMFRRWLNQLGFAKDAELTYGEIEQIVADVVSWTVHGPAGQFDFTTDEAVAYSRDNTAGVEYGRKITESTEKWGKIVEKVFDKTINPRAILQMGETPRLLVELGAPELPLTMRQDTFKKIVGLKPDKHSGHIHYLTKQQMKGLYRELADPTAVLSPHKGKFEVFVDMLEEGKPIMAVIDIDAVEGNVSINSVATAFGQDSGFSNVVGAARRGTLKYMNPKKLNALEDRSDNLKPSESASVRVLKARSKNKIKLPGDVVKPVFSDEVLRFSRKKEASVLASLKAVPSKMIEKAFGELPEFSDYLSSSDMGVLEEVFSLPHWVSKRHGEFAPIYERQLGRMDERASVLRESLEEVEDFFAEMSDRERADLRDLIWKIDGKKLSGMDSDKFIPVEDKEGRPVRENGRVVLEMNPDYYVAFEQWVERQPVSENVKKALSAARTSLDKDFLRAYDAMRSMAEVSDETIQEFRTNINHVHNYFPHKRYGNYYVQGRGKNEIAQTDNGKWVVRNAFGQDVSDEFSRKETAIEHLGKHPEGVVYREHYDAQGKMMAWIKAAKKIKSLKLQYPGISWSDGKNKRLPDDLYGRPIDTNAMEQVINAAADRIDDRGKGDEIRRELAQSIADIMKTRGWSAASIGRKNIAGFEKEDIQGILYDYKAGLSGWLTKMGASRDFTSLLGKIDAQENTRLYTYATTYVRNMLRNSDKIDRVVGNMKGLFFLWYLGFNLKTATLNLTQNIISGVPRLGMEVKGSGSKYLSSAMDTLVDGLTKGQALAPDEARLLNELYKEDVITEGFLNEIRGKVRGIDFSNVWNKLLRAAGAPMAVAERFNRASLALAAYRAARDGKLKNSTSPMEYKEAKRFAEGVVRDGHFVYGKVNLPQPLRNSTIGRISNPAYTFRTFTHNLLSCWNWMLNNQGTEGKKAFAKSMLGTAAIGGFTSLPFYSTAMSLFQWASGEDDDWTEEIRKQLPSNDIVKDVLTYGLPSAAGVSLGGSVGLETPILSRVEPGATAEEAVADNLGDILGIPWDLFVRKPSRTKKALAAGDNWRAFEEIAPTILRNAMAGFRLWRDGQHSFSGRPINEPGKPGPRKLSGAEAVGKAFGFQPISSRKSYDKYSSRKVSGLVRMEESGRLANHLVRAIRNNDFKRVSEVISDWRDWNADAVKERKIWLVISPDDLERRIKGRMKGDNMSLRDALRMIEQKKAY